MQYMGLCVSDLMSARIFVLHLIIIIKSEMVIIKHCLGLGHGTMAYAVSCYILTPFCHTYGVD